MTNSATPPTAEDLEEARDLPWSTPDRLIARLKESRNNAGRVEQLGDLDRRFGLWVALTVSEATLPGPLSIEPDPADDPIFAAIVRENVKLLGTAEVIRRMANAPKPRE